MHNLDFGFDMITRRERDHQCRDCITPGAAPCCVMKRVDLLPDEPANESREWHLVTWYGVIQYVDLKTSALIFRDFVPRLELLTLFRDLGIF